MSLKTNNRVTLKEVARVAGVSVSTASLVLAGKSAERRISAEVEQRVREAAHQRDYSPNLLVRSMQRGQTHVLSFYSSFQDRDPNDIYMDRLAAAIIRAAGQLQYDLLVHCDPARPAEDTYRLLNGGRADGLLFFGPHRSDPLLARLRQSRLPTVILNHVDEEGTLASVCDDMPDGMRQVAEALAELGHRRVAAIEGYADSDARARITVLQENLAARGIALPERHVLPIFNDSPLTPDQAVLQLLDDPEPPTALFIWHDRVGYEVLEACERQGIAVPERLSLIGYDGIHWPSTSQHVLASVEVNLEALAQSAVRLLVSLVEGKQLSSVRQVLPVSFLRGTTLAPPSDRRPTGSVAVETLIL